MELTTVPTQCCEGRLFPLSVVKGNRRIYYFVKAGGSERNFLVGELNQSPVLVEFLKQEERLCSCPEWPSAHRLGTEGRKRWSKLSQQWLDHGARKTGRKGRRQVVHPMKRNLEFLFFSSGVQWPHRTHA